MSMGAHHPKPSARFIRHRVVFAALAVAVLSGVLLLALESAALATATPTFGADSIGDGIQGSDWPTGTPTIIRVFATEDALTPFFEMSVAEDAKDPENGGFYQYVGGPVGCDLQAGQRVVVSNGITTKDTVITPLTVAGVNLATNTVWGHTAPGVGGDIQVWEHDELNSTFSDGNDDGQWSYVFPPGTLQQGWGGSTSQTDADGDSTVADWHVPDPHFVVDPGSAQIIGEDWGLREDVTVTVYSAGSVTPKLTRTSGVSDDWSFIIDSEVTILAGDRVVATDGHTTTTMTVSVLAITSFDYITGVTRGICTAKNPPPSMSGGISTVGGGPVSPSTAGTWSATFDWRPIVPLPLPPATEVWVTETDPSGNSTRASARVPQRPIAVNHEFSVIEGTALIDNFLPGGSYHGPTLDASFPTPPKHGTVDFWPSMGGFIYQPAPGFSGTDSFTYRIADSTPWQTLWSDPATITVTVRPWYLGYNTLTTTTIQLQWPDTADMLPGFDHYVVTDGGSLVATTTGTTRVVNGLQPGTSHVFGVCMVDTLGHQSQLRFLTITIPQEAASVTVDATETATANLVVQPSSGGGSATVTVVITDVTTSGELTLVRMDAPPADAPPTLKFVDEYFDLGFTGSFTGTVRITVPYDPRIPDSRAVDLTLQHWASSHWEHLATTVDLAKHTLTASVTSLSPIVVTEPRDAVTMAKIVPAYRVLYPAYGARATVTASLSTSELAATRLAGFTLVLERQSGASWSRVATLSAVAGSPGSYRTSAAPVGGVRTVFRVRLSTNALYTASSPTIYVVPHARLTAPRSSTTSITHGRRFYVSGQVYPRRAMYVSVQIFRYSRGAYRYVSTCQVKSTSTGTYRRAMTLNTIGTYKFRSYVGNYSASATVSRTYSALSNRVQVK